MLKFILKICQKCHFQIFSNHLNKSFKYEKQCTIVFGLKKIFNGLISNLFTCSHDTLWMLVYK